MKTRLTLVALAAVVATPVLAQDQVRTRTYEGPNVSTETTTTSNRETGTITRDRSATNLNNGNTATSNAVRQRTDTGATLDVQQTGPQGNTRSLTGERVRDGNGSTFNGTATGREGNEFGVTDTRSRDRRGNSSASQRVTGPEGNTVFRRDRTTTRNQNGVNRNVTRSRAPGFKPRRAGRPR